MRFMAVSRRSAGGCLAPAGAPTGVAAGAAVAGVVAAGAVGTVTAAGVVGVAAPSPAAENTTGDAAAWGAAAPRVGTVGNVNTTAEESVVERVCCGVRLLGVVVSG